MKRVGLLFALILFAVPMVVDGQKTSSDSKLIHKRVIVASTNDEWTRTHIKVKPDDLIIILAEGKIKIGEWIGEVDADGNAGADGSLYAKIGTGAGFRVGKRAVFHTEDSGTLKLKVKDGVYTDNSGNFEVMVLCIPPDALPEPEVVEAD